MTLLRKILAITLQGFDNRSRKPRHRGLAPQVPIDHVNGIGMVAHSAVQSDDELRSRLEALSARQRSVFLAFTFDRMTDAEVALYHGISRRAVRRALYEAVSIIDRGTIPERRSWAPVLALRCLASGHARALMDTVKNLANHG